MSPTADEFEHLQSQMKGRMKEGQGETIYEIGTGGDVHTVDTVICCEVLVSYNVFCFNV